LIPSSSSPLRRAMFPAPSLAQLSPKEAMRSAEHLLAMPRRKLRTYRRLTRLRPHQGRTAAPKETGLPPRATTQVARHQDLVIGRARDRFQIERLVVQRTQGDTVLDHVGAAV